MNCPRFLVPVFGVLFFSISITSQNTKREIDSLFQVALSAPDSLKFDIYNRMAFHYIFNDSEKADSILKKSLEEARERNHLYGEVLLTNTYGIQYDVNQEYDSAYYYFDRARALSRKSNFKYLEARSLNNLGMNAWNQGKLSLAQDYFFEALEMSQKHDPHRRTDSYLNNIGLIYQELERLDMALEYHNKALEERKARNVPVPQISSYNNIGICHRILGNYQQSLDAYGEGLKIMEEVGAYQQYQRLNNNMGNVYLDMKEYHNAIKVFAYAKEKHVSGKFDEKTSFMAFGGLAYAHFLNGDTSLAHKEMTEALSILKKEPSFRMNAETLYKAASAIAVAQNRPNEGAYYIDSLQVLLTERFSDENAAALANAETKYKTAEKEAALAKTRATLAETELDVRKRNNIIYAVVIVALILGLLGYLFYNQQRLKNRQQAREFELKNALAIIETQNKLQEQRLRISRDLHDNIGSQLTFITSSLDTLKYGMKEKDTATKDKITEIGAFTKTTINELRDTIWAMNKEVITFEDLEGRLGNLLEQVRAARPNLDVAFSMSEYIDRSKALTSVEGVHVYRIIQEATTNAIKYAAATRLEIAISEVDNKILVVIKDNGKGFDAATVTFGNGLRNMEKRASDIEAQYNLTSTPSGTTLRLELML